uniref:Uncharacterized protein n=1 Tax=Chromera velia CCMP2878 TaxID=1169474 RepID=A0A0G4FTH5_9ALVE|eukprot:Cvel_3712.t1-p1 / transcript=Cvel_3712.t1 / gene=Cvel_3712 / organism=Chromera_velia_CCMP2878 / gene_product=hypothetical protein / transcript_product=hypothetical protein / location=Cvel_scaffold154:88659-89930(+) / protein_length=424 / sequence_SO=supercontig / SO=protein_coding / is_pseudo=false
MTEDEPGFLCLGILIGSGILGRRGFWKLSSVCKEVLSLRDALRDETTSIGFGSVCSGFSSDCEREEVWSFFDSCFESDNVRALQQILALKGVSGRYPFLLKRAIEKNPASVKCIAFLTNEETTPALSDLVLQTEFFGKLTREQFVQMIEGGVVRTDHWKEAEGLNGGRAVRPLVEILIANSHFDLAEALLDAGARVDVCGWEIVISRRHHPFLSLRPFSSSDSRCCFTPLLALVHGLSEDSTGHVTRRSGRGRSDAQRERGLSLLRRLAKASKDAACLDWKVKFSSTYGDGPPGRVTALGLACFYRDPEIVKVLVEEQGHVESKEGGELVFMVLDPKRYRPLSESRCHSDDDSLCAALLEQLLQLRGFELNRIKTQSGERLSPLSLAISQGMEKSAEVLLKGGAAPGIVKGWSGMNSPSPLFKL